MFSPLSCNCWQYHSYPSINRLHETLYVVQPFNNYSSAFGADSTNQIFISVNIIPSTSTMRLALALLIAVF
jgi:hypothetical protein